MKRKLLLVGGGGHCQSVIDVVEATQQYQIVGIVDQARKIGEKVSGYEITETDEHLDQLVRPDRCFLITVGQIMNSDVRYRLYRQIQQAGGQLATVVSPRAYVSPRAVVGVGSVVLHDALVNAYARIGANTIVNTKALVEHGAQVGNHCHVATGAIINGDCQLHNRVFVGSNATVAQGVTIHERIVIGAGAVVTHSLSEPGVYLGVPARRKE